MNLLSLGESIEVEQRIEMFLEGVSSHNPWIRGLNLLHRIARNAYQIHAGYPGNQSSGKAIICAPFEAASLIRCHVFVTVPAKSNQTGSA